MRVKLLPHAPSNGAKNLSEILGIKRLKAEGSKFVAREGDVIINWGCPRPQPQLAKALILNNPEDVREWSDKLNFFRNVAEHNNDLVPPWTTEQDQARLWVEEGGTVMCRTLLNSSGGKGIVVAERPEDVVPAPLYTKYIKKKSEWRAHFFGTQIRDMQQKLKRRDVDEANYKIRNLENGFIYGRRDIICPPTVHHMASEIAHICPLDFGAIDIIYNERSSVSFALEINTAPGLEGETLEVYNSSIRGALDFIREEQE